MTVEYRWHRVHGRRLHVRSAKRLDGIVLLVEGDLHVSRKLPGWMCDPAVFDAANRVSRGLADMLDGGGRTDDRARPPERARLTDALAIAARPREREYAIHDTALQGFLLRVQPNGKPRRVTLGKPGAVEGRRRTRCGARLPRPREGRRKSPSPSCFRPDADQVRRRIRRAALALMEAVHGSRRP